MKITCCVSVEKSIAFIGLPCGIKECGGRGLKEVTFINKDPVCVKYEQLVHRSSLNVYACAYRNVLTVNHDVDFVFYM